MKLIHITDTHLVIPGAKLYGLDPRARLDAAIADINRHHSDADLMVVTGDLTHFGEPAAYESFKACLAATTIPHVVLLGNHDRRAACLASLAAAPRDEAGFVQGYRDVPDGRLIFLDTLDERSHAGQMCARRLGWMETTLKGTPQDRPLFIFMHHPPFKVGIKAMDDIALAEHVRFAEITEPYRARICHLFFGHVHRPISGSWRGVPFSTLRGTNHQVWFDLSKRPASVEPRAASLRRRADRARQRYCA